MCQCVYWRKIKSLSETAWSALRAANPKAAHAGDLSEFFYNLAGTECEVANTSTPVFVITDKTLKCIEKLVENLKKLGIKDVNGELVYDEEEAGYEYLQ